MFGGLCGQTSHSHKWFMCLCFLDLTHPCQVCSGFLHLLLYCKDQAFLKVLCGGWWQGKLMCLQREVPLSLHSSLFQFCTLQKLFTGNQGFNVQRKKIIAQGTISTLIMTIICAVASSTLKQFTRKNYSLMFSSNTHFKHLFCAKYLLLALGQCSRLSLLLTRVIWNTR